MRIGGFVGVRSFSTKTPVNLNLNADLVEQCRFGVSNLSAHVEALLAADLEQRGAAHEAERRKTEQAIDAFADLYREYGSLSEGMQKL